MYNKINNFYLKIYWRDEIIPDSTDEKLKILYIHRKRLKNSIQDLNKRGSVLAENIKDLNVEIEQIELGCPFVAGPNKDFVNTLIELLLKNRQCIEKEEKRLEKIENDISILEMKQSILSYSEDG